VHQITEHLGSVAHDLLAYWAQLPKREWVPDRHAFDPMAIARILPVVSVLQREAGGDWRFRLVGTEIERRWERPLTGLSYFDINIVSRQAADIMRLEMSQVVEWPCGSWSLRRVEFRSGRRAVVETLRLPLRANDGSVGLIVSCSGELHERAAPADGAAREIIMITEHQFLDIGAGTPPDGALAAPGA
jgi:hypothetical protein